MKLSTSTSTVTDGQPRSRAIWQWIWSALATIVLVPLAFWGMSFDELWESLRHANWLAVMLAGVLFVLTTLAKTMRWQIFLRPRQVRFSSLFAALAVGQLVNFLLPARLGDVARIYVLRRREGEQIARTLGTVGAEKVVEMVALVLLTVCVTPFVPLPVWLREPSLRLTLIVLSFIIVMSLVFMQQAQLQTLWRWVAQKFGRGQARRMEQQFDLTLEGFAALRRPEQWWVICSWSVVVWALMIATNYVLFWALPLERSWLAATVLLLVLQVGIAVPTTPGKIGIFQYLAILTLSLFGVSYELALGYGILLYVVVFVPQVLMALVFVGFVNGRMTIRRVQAVESAPSFKSIQ